MASRVDEEKRTAPAADLVGVGAAVLGAALFSTKPILVKLAYVDGMDALTLLTLRMLMALPFYVVIGLLAWRRARNLDGRLLLAILGCGLLGYYAAALLDFTALEHITAQLERLVLFTNPLFVVLLGAMFFAVPLRRLTIPALLVAYAGLALVFLASMQRPGAGDVLLGTAMVAGAALLSALFQLFASRLVQRVGSTLFTSVAMSSACAGLVTHFALSRPLSSLAASQDMLLLILALAVLATVAPTYLINFALGRIGADNTAMVGNAGPLFTIGLSAMLLGEPFGPLEAAGTALVLIGMLLFARR